MTNILKTNITNYQNGMPITKIKLTYSLLILVLFQAMDVQPMYVPKLHRIISTLVDPISKNNMTNYSPKPSKK